MVNVYIVKLSGKKNYYAQYRDPITGKRVRKTTGESKKADARKVGTAWEKEINSGVLVGCSWDHFREMFRTEHIVELRESTAKSYETILDQLETFSKPSKLQSVNGAFISRWRGHLSKIGASKATRRTYLRTLKAALNWAVSNELLPSVPNFPKEKRTDTGKHRGRALTAAEVQAMIDTVPTVVSDSKASEAYQRLIRGLYLSGLRVGESQNLSWDDDSLILADLTGKFPMFRFHGSLQKNGKTETVPMAPDFAEWLKETPEAERTGMVMTIPFPADWPKEHGDAVGVERVAKIVAKVGKATGIKTGKASTPTAHDLRRSFASRWSRKVLPAVLQTIMRHASIETTMKFYVGSQAEAIAAEMAGLDLSE